VRHLIPLNIEYNMMEINISNWYKWYYYLCQYSFSRASGF